MATYLVTFGRLVDCDKPSAYLEAFGDDVTLDAADEWEAREAGLVRLATQLGVDVSRLAIDDVEAVTLDGRLWGQIVATLE